jgi:hypothetical protein
MNVTIGPYTFDNNDYDNEPDEVGGDVLYLDRGDPNAAVDWDATPEGHALRFGPGDEIIGITIIHPRYWLERDGQITITLPGLPEPLHVDAAALAPAMKQPA